MLNLNEFTAVPDAFEQTIQAMRAELAEYGAVLNLLDQQQEAILDGRGGMVREFGEAIAAQLKTVRACELLVATLTPNTGPEDQPVPMLALFPPPMRPLVAALADEIDRLSSRVRLRMQQNQTLWARTMKDISELRNFGAQQGATPTGSSHHCASTPPSAGRGELIRC